MFRILRLALLAAMLALPAAAEELTVTDLAGRSVTVTLPVSRIVLSEARQIPTLAMIDPSVADRIAGTAGTRLFDPEAREAYFMAFPRLAAALKLDDEASNLSAEKALNAEPDLVIMSGGMGPNPKSDALVATLESAGIPTIYIDLRANPFPTMELLGKVLGKEEQARAFVDFYLEHRQAVLDRVAGIADRPKVLLEMQAGAESYCCIAPSRVNLGRFVAEAGGINIGEAVVPGAFSPLAPEYVLTENPEVFIGTGGRHLASTGGVVAGPGISREEALASLERITARPVIAELRAVKERRAYGLWHNYHNSPLNIVALELMAKWFHPQAFADLDPQATIDEINARFLPVPFEGATWIGLPAQ